MAPAYHQTERYRQIEANVRRDLTNVFTTNNMNQDESFTFIVSQAERERKMYMTFNCDAREIVTTTGGLGPYK